MSRFAILVALFCLVLVGLFVGVGPGSSPVVRAADASAPAVIGVVDVQVILRDSTAMKSIQNQVETKRGQFQTEITGQEKKLRDQEQELKRQQSVLAADAFEAKRRDFEAQVASVQRDVQERRRVLDQAYGDGLKVVQKELTEIIAGIAKERGFTLVLPVGQTLYAEATLAVTDEALKRLNKKLPDVPLQFGAASSAAKPNKK